MTCPNCGRHSPPDRQTGYDVDEECPACKWASIEANAKMRAFSEIVDRAAMAHQSALQDLATIGSEVARTSDRMRLWYLLEMARELETRARVVTDNLFARVEAVMAEEDEPDVRGESPF